MSSSCPSVFVVEHHASTHMFQAGSQPDNPGTWYVINTCEKGIYEWVLGKVHHEDSYSKKQPKMVILTNTPYSFMTQ